MQSVKLNQNSNFVAFKAKRNKENNKVGSESKKVINKKLDTLDKQVTIKNAKTKASFYSIFFQGFDTLYYGLRSDDKIASQFELDNKNDKDKKLIKKIRNEQVKSTLPRAITGLISTIVAYGVIKKEGVLSSKIKTASIITNASALIGVGTYLFNKIRPAKDIKLNE